MFVKLNSNGVPVKWPVFANDIKKENPNVSFPKNWDNVDLSSLGFGSFRNVSAPDYDHEYQELQELEPTLTDGTYVQTWSVVDKYNAQERTTYDATKEATRLERLPAENRSKRDGLLEETDWWALSDVTMTDDQRSYRQALRDITSHSNWPDLNDDDWPTKP